MVGSELKNVILHTSKSVGKDLSETIQEFINGFGESFPKTFAVLYSPGECFLALVKDKNNFEFFDKTGNLATVNLKNIFEARIFNEKAELRWFNDNGKGIAVTLSETETDEDFGGDILLANPQKYLLWGEISPNKQADENWTELAEARIGKFFVPIKTTSRACFQAIEYLKSYDDQDGNVAVFEERLTGIEPYPSNKKGGKENA